MNDINGGCEMTEEKLKKIYMDSIILDGEYKISDLDLPEYIINEIRDAKIGDSIRYIGESPLLPWIISHPIPEYDICKISDGMINIRGYTTYAVYEEPII